jgi:hypothetical protein
MVVPVNSNTTANFSEIPREKVTVKISVVLCAEKFQKNNIKLSAIFSTNNKGICL